MMNNISHFLIVWIAICGLTVSSSSRIRFSQNAQSKFRRSISNFQLHGDANRKTSFTPTPLSFGASNRHTTISSLLSSNSPSLSAIKTSRSTFSRLSFANTLKVNAPSSLSTMPKSSFTSSIPPMTFSAQTIYATPSALATSKVSSTYNMKIQSTGSPSQIKVSTSTNISSKTPSVSTRKETSLNLIISTLRTSNLRPLTSASKNLTTSSTLRTIQLSNAPFQSTVWKSSKPTQAIPTQIVQTSSISQKTVIHSTVLTSKPTNNSKTTTTKSFQKITTQKPHSGDTATKTVSSKTTPTKSRASNTTPTMLTSLRTKSTDQSKTLMTINPPFTKTSIQTTKEPPKTTTTKSLPSIKTTIQTTIEAAKTSTAKSSYSTKTAIQTTTTTEPSKTTTPKIPPFTKTSITIMAPSITTTPKSLPLSKTTIQTTAEPSKTTTTKSPPLTKTTIQTTTVPSKTTTPKSLPFTKTTIQTTIDSKTLIPISLSSIKTTPPTTDESHLSSTISSNTNIHISNPPTSNEPPSSGITVSNNLSTASRLKSSMKTTSRWTVHKSTLPEQTIQASTATAKGTPSTSAIVSTATHLKMNTTVSPIHRNSASLSPLPSSGSDSGKSTRFTSTVPLTSTTANSQEHKHSSADHGYSSSNHHTNNLYTTEMHVSSTSDISLSNQIPQRTGLSKRSIGAIAAACTIVGCIGIILGLYLFVSKRYKSGEKTWAVVDDHTRIETIDMSEKMDNVLHDYDQGERKSNGESFRPVNHI